MEIFPATAVRSPSGFLIASVPFPISMYGTGIFSYIYHRNQPKNVGKYTSPMDP